MPVPTRVDFVEERKQKRTSTDTKGLYSLWKKQEEGGRGTAGINADSLSLKTNHDPTDYIKICMTYFLSFIRVQFYDTFYFYGHSKTKCVFLYFNSDRNKSNQQ